MATTLFLRNTTLHDLGGPGQRFDLLASRGPTTTQAVVNTAASGTDIQWTNVGGGTVLEWISPPLSAGVTISGTMTFNIWARESSMAANAGGRVHVLKWGGGDGNIAELTGSPFSDGIEFGFSGANANFNWTGAATGNNVFLVGDRIIVRYAITNVGVMGGGATCNLGYDGPTAAADGDSSFATTETLSFAAEENTGVLGAFPGKPVIGSALSGVLTPHHAWLFNEHSPRTIRDVIGQRHLTWTPEVANSALHIRVRGQGLRLKSTRETFVGPNSTFVLPTGPCTALIAARQELIDPNGAAYLFDSGSAVSAELGRLWLTGTGAGTATLDWGASQLQATGLTGQRDSVWTVSVGPRGMEIWQDGVKKASNATNPTRTATTTAFRSGIGMNMGSIGLLYLWKRQLTAAEIKFISAHPYAPFDTGRFEIRMDVPPAPSTLLQDPIGWGVIPWDR